MKPAGAPFAERQCVECHYLTPELGWCRLKCAPIPPELRCGGNTIMVYRREPKPWAMEDQPTKPKKLGDD